MDISNYKFDVEERLNEAIIELNKMDGKFIGDIFDKFNKKLEQIEGKNNGQQV